MSDPALAIEEQQPQQAQSPERTCPDCGSTATRFIQRGYTGPTDERDQYFICEACGRKTYEIVSRTSKEIRIGRMEAGRQVRVQGSDYLVSRVLKAGVAESLVYLKPVEEKSNSAPRFATRLRPERR